MTSCRFSGGIAFFTFSSIDPGLGECTRTPASKATIVDFDLEQRSCMRITSSRVSVIKALLASALYFTVWIHVFSDFDRFSLV